MLRLLDFLGIIVDVFKKIVGYSLGLEGNALMVGAARLK
jgi:hypothetical protein